VAIRLAALLGALLVLAGCAAPVSAAPQGFADGSTVHTMSFGGLDRSYRLYIPAGLPTPAPLVVMLHGGFGSAQQAERAYGWDQLADSAKFVVAYPDGVGRAWNVKSPHPTSVMHIHGTADRLIRYGGGPGMGVAHIDGPAVPDLNSFWRNVDQCGAPAVSTNGAVTTSTADCADGRNVVLMTVDGGGHEWPSFAT
jgi:poly(3-hydroxybutyrate) depolymerase